MSLALRLAPSSVARLALRLALAVGLCAAMVADAAAQSPQRIAVVVTTAVNMKEGEVDELSAALGQALEQSLGVVVTAGAETRVRLPEGGLPEGCVANAACRADLGERLDADELLLLVVARVGSRVQIDTTWIDVPSGKLASRPAVVLERGADREEVFRGAAQTLLPHLQPVPTMSEIRPATEAPAPLARPLPERSERHMTGGAWIATGIGAAALAGSLGMGYFNYDTFQRLDSDAPCAGGGRGCVDADSDALRRNSLIADGLAAVSLVAGVTALVLYLGSDAPVDEQDDALGERTGARGLRPVVGLGPEHIAISVGGAF